MARAADPGRLAAAWAARQLIHRPRTLSHPADVLRAIAGAQAQEPAAGRLALRARSSKLTAADVERARVEERSIVRIWVMRKTAHLVATDDLPWLRPLFAPLMAAFNRRRLAHLGVNANAQGRALSLIDDYLQREGPLTRTALSERLERAGIPMDASRRAHIFPLAVSTGLAHLGPGDGGATQLVLVHDWIPHAPDLDRDAALAELTRRYFQAFGPATEADFAAWAGLSRRDVRAGIKAVVADLREVTILGASAWQPKRRPPAALAENVVRLLPAYDTYLMGHRRRELIAAPRDWPEIGPGGGILRPTVTVAGRAVGTWRLRRSGKRLRSEILPFGRLGEAVGEAVDAELDDIARFEGLEKWRGGAVGGRGSTRPAPRLRVGSQGGMPTRSSPEAGLAGDES